MKPVQAGSAFSSRIRLSSSAALVDAGSWTSIEAMPTCAQSRCLPRT